MNTTIINYAKLYSFFLKEKIKIINEISWFNYSGFLNEVAFQALYETYPKISFFEEHRGLKRLHEQTPHDRFYLAFEKSIHHSPNYSGPGVITMQQLPRCWQDLIGELKDTKYNAFVQQTLGLNTYKLRFDWHVGINGSEVSPHIDADTKLASHLFYFNTSLDWKQEWGGRTLILNSKKSSVMNPSFDDFGEKIEIDILNNRSLLFKNSKTLWHGVECLKCPENSYRKLFNVIFEVSSAEHLTLRERANM